MADLERQLEDVEGKLLEECHSSALAKQEKEELKMKVSNIEGDPIHYISPFFAK